MTEQRPLTLSLSPKGRGDQSDFSLPSAEWVRET